MQAHLLSSAFRRQRDLRWGSVGSLLYAAAAMTLAFTHLINFVPAATSIIASIFVYWTHYQTHGHITNWWWFRRGHIVTIRDFNDLDEARRWLKEGSLDWQEVHPACFKFFGKGGAALFKLSWG